MTNNEKALWTIILGLVGIIFISPLLTLYGGFFFSTIWGWFAVKLIGLPALNTYQSAGILFLYELFDVKAPKEDKKSFNEAVVTNWIFKLFVWPLLLLGAFILSLYIM